MPTSSRASQQPTTGTATRRRAHRWGENRCARLGAGGRTDGGESVRPVGAARFHRARTTSGACEEDSHGSTTAAPYRTFNTTGRKSVIELGPPERSLTAAARRVTCGVRGIPATRLRGRTRDLDAALRAELDEDVGDVRLNGVAGEEQLAGDGGIGQPLGDKMGDLLLGGGQGVPPRGRPAAGATAAAADLVLA